MSAEPLDLRTGRPEDFEPHVDSAFVLERDEGPIELLLASVTRFDAQPSAPRVDSFSLVFVGPPSIALRQGTYRISHPDLGAIDLFIVPIGPQGAGGYGYEAVFN